MNFNISPNLVSTEDLHKEDNKIYEKEPIK